MLHTSHERDAIIVLVASTQEHNTKYTNWQDTTKYDWEILYEK